MKKYDELALVLANLVPAAGVLFFGWSVFAILFMYWLESAVIGIYNIPKMLMAKPSKNEAAVPGVINQGFKVSGVIFFIIHYSIFMSVHLVFLLELFGPEDG